LHLLETTYEKFSIAVIPTDKDIEEPKNQWSLLFTTSIMLKISLRNINLLCQNSEQSKLEKLRRSLQWVHYELAFEFDLSLHYLSVNAHVTLYISFLLHLCIMASHSRPHHLAAACHFE